MSAHEIPDDDDSLPPEPSGAPAPALGWRERRASESGADGSALAPFEPEIPARLQALARVLSSSARPRWMVTDEEGDDAGMEITALNAEPRAPAGEPAVSAEAPIVTNADALPAVSAEAPPAVSAQALPATPAPLATPRPMVPIAVPLPLVSPPPVSEPSHVPAPPRATRWRKAAALAVCGLMGLAVALPLRAPKRATAPAVVTPAEAPTAPAPVAVEAPPAPQPPASAAATEPPRADKAPAAGKGNGGAVTASSPCRVLSGRPCF
jgi:hypothetical protein